jgi:two-component system, NtrC family, sensor kinase
VRQRWDPVALPVLLVTAKADAESISAAFDAGASDYITKPFLGAELRSRVTAHLRLKRMLDERARMEDHLREREKLSALGLLVSGVAHDLNNPLTGIAGYAQLLLRSETDAERAEDLRYILQDVERCRRIVRDLLGFARRHPVEPTLLDLNEVLYATFELRERHLLDRGIRGRLQLDTRVPRVMADAHQMQQVFLNILLNAEQALRDHGGVLEVSVSSHEGEGEGTPDVGAPAAWVVVEFFNDGPPIPPEQIPSIFDPFFTTKPKDEGTGLGLAICQRIVRDHGGEISVRSTAEDGTVFRVQIPGSASAAVSGA